MGGFECGILWFGMMVACLERLRSSVEGARCEVGWCLEGREFGLVFEKKELWIGGE